MTERGAIDFEPVVEFPNNGFDAARLYLGLMAYPERGAGQPGNAGSGFAEALWKYYIWQRRRARGLNDVRRAFNDPSFAPPTLRESRGKIERGRKRIERRCAAYDIVGNQMVNGILNTGLRATDAKASGRIADPYLGKEGDKFRPFKPEIIKLATPSKHEIIRRNLERYSQRLGLNETGTPNSQRQKIRDLVGRGFYQSRSVLHLAHGLNTVIPRAEKNSNSSRKRTGC